MPTTLASLTKPQLEDVLTRINNRLVALDWEVERPREERDKIRRGLVTMHRRVTAQLTRVAA